MNQAVAHTTCNHDHSGSVLSVYESVDPTRTVTLRARYAKEMRKRFRELRGMILDAVVNKDVFGLSENQFNIQVNASAPVNRGQFAFPRHRDKVSAFMEWLNRQIDRNILEVRNRQRIGASIDETWQNIFIEDSYKRGVIRGNQELRKAAFPDVQTLEDRGGMAAVMGQPFHADRLGVLYTRAFNELKGITDNMDQQISRVLTQGLADGDNPRLLGRKLNAVIKGGGADLGLTDSLGRFIPAERRAQILARTEVIRAHHQGMMQEYRNWGVEGVEVQAEFRTAGDDRVCWECDSLQGTVYSLDEAQNLIPVHPMCRCIVLPHRPGTDTSSTGQTVEATETQTFWNEAGDYDTAKQQASEVLHATQVINTSDLPRADKLARLNAVGDAIGNQVFGKLPKLKNQLDEFSSTQMTRQDELARQWRQWTIKLENATPENGLIGSPGAAGEYVQSSGWMRLAGDRINNQPKLSIGPNNWTVGNDLKSTARHEFGHYVERARVLEREGVLRFNELYDEFGNQVSKYGATSRSEFFAESFSAFTDPQYGTGGNRLPEPVEEFFIKYFQ